MKQHREGYVLLTVIAVTWFALGLSALAQGTPPAAPVDPYGITDAWNAVRTSGPIAILLLAALIYCNRERISEKNAKIEAQKEAKAVEARYREDALSMQKTLQNFDGTARMFGGAIDKLVDVVDAMVENSKAGA